jgi:hypothetical protein
MNETEHDQPELQEVLNGGGNEVDVEMSNEVGEVEEEVSIGLPNGQFVEDSQKSHNGAEAYENLVKSLTECDESFQLIEGNMLETIAFSRESEELF